jgi:HK97 family phage prohead protease
MHDPREVIGVWTDLAEDERGLKVAGHLVLETARGSEAHALLKAGALDGLSIGFRARSAERGANGGRVLTDIDLVEISLVSLPAASKARVTTVKTMEDAGSAAAFVNACRKATRSLNQRSKPCKTV